MRAALARGHKLTVVSRQARPRLQNVGVEVVAGDRSSDLSGIAFRTFDAVIDVAVYLPSWLRVLRKALRGQPHYIFVSTIDVYDTQRVLSEEISEQTPLLTDLISEDVREATDIQSSYGALKALCEGVAHSLFGPDILIVRPCYIVGPWDRVGALTYWALRLQEPGPILAADKESAPVHFIDVRDLAGWMVEATERRLVGAFNLVGPRTRTCWGALLGALCDLFNVAPQIVWVPSEWLAARGHPPYSVVRFWSDGITSRSRYIRSDMASAAGLSLRPLANTVADVMSWFEALPHSERGLFVRAVTEPQDFCVTLQKERLLLADWQCRSCT